eukprot:6084955-Prymnesium_polylepis.1
MTDAPPLRRRCGLWPRLCGCVPASAGVRGGRCGAASHTLRYLLEKTTLIGLDQHVRCTSVLRVCFGAAQEKRKELCPNSYDVWAT